MSDHVGDGSFALIAHGKVRLLAEFGPYGWSYSVYDGELKRWLVIGTQADSEEDARQMAQYWAVSKEKLMWGDTVNWTAKPES